MYIFVDESGTFTESKDADSWCVVAAYVVPENQIHHVGRIVRQLRSKYGGTETKLSRIRESDYFEVLHKLSVLPGLAFAVACDVNLHSKAAVEMHRDTQARGVLRHVDRMRHETARQDLQNLASDIEALPFQLYAQLTLQVLLFDEVLRRSTFYYSQRRPIALSHFRWRLDRKNTTPTAYEDVFLRLLPALLQTSSVDNPMVMLSDGGSDYSYFKRFEFENGSPPEFLNRDYGLTVENGANIGKIVGEDMELVDSANVDGVQVADLLASGVRRLLRGGFDNPSVAARLLGCNMTETIKKGHTPIRLVSLDVTSSVSSRNAGLIRTMGKQTKPLLLKSRYT